MKSILALPLLAASASAHATFQALWVDGVSTGSMEAGVVRHKWQNTPQSNYPHKDAGASDISCGTWGTTFAPKTASVKAGSKVTAEWHHEPTQAQGDKDEPIAESHHGPILAYLGKVDKASSASPSGVKWFKIYEDADNTGNKWATDRLRDNKGKVDITIPSCVANGDYLFRVEIIGLHEADALPGPDYSSGRGAQLYPNCAQITVTGGGNAAPATVDFPGAYKNGGTGLLVNIYGNTAAYTAPGPKVFTCGANSGSGSPAPQPQPSSPAPAPSSSAKPTTLVTKPATKPVTSAAPAPTGGNTTPTVPTTPSNPPASGGVRPTKDQVASFWAELQRMYADWEKRGRP